MAKCLCCGSQSCQTMKIQDRYESVRISDLVAIFLHIETSPNKLVSTDVCQSCCQKLYNTYKLKKSAEQQNRVFAANLNPEAKPFTPFHRAAAGSVQEIFYNNEKDFSSPFAKFAATVDTSITPSPTSSNPNASSSQSNLHSISDYEYFRNEIKNSSSICEVITEPARDDDVIKPSVLFNKTKADADKDNEDENDGKTFKPIKIKTWAEECCSDYSDSDIDKTLVPSSPKLKTWYEECSTTSDEEILHAFEQKSDIMQHMVKPKPKDNTASSEEAFYMIHIGG